MKYKLLLCSAIIANSFLIYSNENIVKTDSGITYGYIKNGTVNWDDIPYALPPDGILFDRLNNLEGNFKLGGRSPRAGSTFDVEMLVYVEQINLNKILF